MKNQIIIHGSGKQTRIALIENGELAQLFIEAPENQRTVGDIYLAEVRNLMAGIRAAFISMGTPKDAFLHFSDVGDNLENYITMLNGDDAVNKAIAHNKEMNKRYSGGAKESTDGMSAGVEKQMRAGEVLQNGQRLLVQIVKEPMGSKGPRVSTDITIAGRFVVLIPMGDYVAVSKRIRSFKERRRLRNVVTNKMPDGFGIIVRTVAQNQPDNVLIEDVEDVLQKWEKIQSQIKSAKPPALLYRDLDMTESLIRDLFAKDYNQVLIDDPAIHKQIKNSVSKWAPEMVPNIKLYKGKEHIFDFMHVSADVESVFSPRVKMPSGGYLIFEQTEAMYVVDVNSGRYAAKRQQEENSLKTNLEAAREIAKQLRLRDIGGIIVVDFIDLRDDVNRKKVYDELKKEFRKDKAKTNVLAMSDFGLVQITRQRIRPSVVKSISKVCPMCGGTGELVSQNTVIADIEAWLSKFRHSYHKMSVDLYVNPYLRSFLTKGLFSERLKWLIKYRVKASVIIDETISMNDYRFTLPGSDVDITEIVMQDKPIEAALKASEEELLRLTSESKMDKSKLDVYDKRNDRHSHKGSKYRDLDEDYDEDEDHDDDDDDSEMEIEIRPRKIISSKDKSVKKTESEQEQHAPAPKPHRVIEKTVRTEEKVVEEPVKFERVEEDKSKYRQALEVAAEYAKLHNIEVKLPSDVEEEDDYSDDDDHDSDSHTELSQEDSTSETNSDEIKAIEVKSSIQFVETEDEETIELEIYKETVEVIEKQIVATESEEDELTDSSVEDDDQENSIEETSDSDEEAPKKKRGKKPIKVSKKITETETPRQIIQSSSKAKKNKPKTDDETSVESVEEIAEEVVLVEKPKKTSPAKKSSVRKSTKKVTENKDEVVELVDKKASTDAQLISSNSDEVVKEKQQPKIRVSTTSKSTKAPKAVDDSENQN